MKRIALVLAFAATFASAAQKVRLYGEAREVTSIPVLSDMSGASAETNIGFSGAIGVQTPVNRQVLFDAHTSFLAARWGMTIPNYELKYTSYFQSIGAGFQFHPTKVFGLGLGFAYDIALDNNASSEFNGTGTPPSVTIPSLNDKNVALAEFGASVKVSRHLDIVGVFRLPLTEYANFNNYFLPGVTTTSSSKVKLHQLNIGLRYTFNAKPAVDVVE